MSARTRALHLFVLVSFAVAEPLYAILRPKAAFFVVRRSEPVDLVVLAFALGLALPLALWVVEEVLGRVHRRTGRVLYGALVLVLLTLVAAAPLVRALEEAPGLVLLIASAIGSAGLVLYLRWEPARSFLSLLTPAPLVFAGLFLFHPSIARFRAGAGEGVLLDTGVADAPTVVMVVLDELPVTSLMADEDSIDASLFPSFARLARDATWFRNATTSHESTVYALPAILTGKRPDDRSLLPTLNDHPENLFTMLGGSHRMKIWETFTSLCPASLAGAGRAQPDPFSERMLSLASDLTIVYAHVVLPETLTAGLPSVTSNWSGFVGDGERATGGAAGGAASDLPTDSPSAADDRESDEVLEAKKAAARVGRTEKFREFVAAIDDDPRPTLYFLHLLTPHGPWNRLRSGRRYDEGSLPRSWAAGRWPETENYSAFALQRHLMQLGHVDNLLGELLAALEANGVYDRSLILLVADHGISFAPGQHGRQTYPESVRKIVHVPLFIKRPFQGEGSLTDRNVETIDLLPTIADVLGIDLPWALDGTSAFSAGPARPQKTVYRRLEPLVLDGQPPARWPELRRKRRLFGEPASWLECFAVGGGSEWLGRPLAELDVAPPAGTFALDRPERFAQVERRADDAPCSITGRLSCAALPERIAVALNGVVCSTGYVFEPDDDQGTALFAAMIPPSSLRRGANIVQVLGISDEGRLFRLRREDR